MLSNALLAGWTLLTTLIGFYVGVWSVSGRNPLARRKPYVAKESPVAPEIKQKVENLSNWLKQDFFTPEDYASGNLPIGGTAPPPPKFTDPKASLSEKVKAFK